MFPSSTDSPIDTFGKWFAEAQNDTSIKQPDSVNLATADKNGVPSSRMVLLKGFDAKGFVFYTNFGSRKAQELAENPHAALCFFWQSLGKQVRVVGKVEKVSDKEADEYFASRPRQSRIGAIASKQSTSLTSNKELVAKVAKLNLQYGVGEIPRPDFWGGYRVVPTEIEFWQIGEFRIHKRMTFHKQNDIWEGIKLYP